ncbi:unnamed protein product [Rotaria magnacalcarata]
MDAVNVVAHRLMIVLGIIMFIFGLIGNFLNIYVFLSWSRLKKNSRRKSHNARSSNSSLYLLTSSISNLIIIIFPFLTRIIFDGFQYSLNHRNGFILCKLRYYVLHTFDLTSLTCICMATFDRYLISSRQVRLRHMSTHSNRILFRRFKSSFIPILFLTIFGVLTYRQLKKIKRTKRRGVFSSDKRLSRMLLLMSAAIVLSSIPYCIEHIYNVLIRKDPFNQPSHLYLYHVITSLLFYTNPVTSFYIFFISTPNFRKQVRKLFFCIGSDCNYDTESFTMITTIHNSHE